MKKTKAVKKEDESEEDVKPKIGKAAAPGKKGKGKQQDEEDVKPDVKKGKGRVKKEEEGEEDELVSGSRDGRNVARWVLMVCRWTACSSNGGKRKTRTIRSSGPRWSITVSCSRPPMWPCRRTSR